MKQNSKFIMITAAMFGAAFLIVSPAMAEEKYLPPAPIGDINAATANVVAPPPVVPTTPGRPPSAAADIKLPQYDTGPNVAPPGAAAPANQVIPPVMPPVKIKSEILQLPKVDTFHAPEMPKVAVPTVENKEKPKPATDLKDTKPVSEPKTKADDKAKPAK